MPTLGSIAGMIPRKTARRPQKQRGKSQSLLFPPNLVSLWYLLLVELNRHSAGKVEIWFTKSQAQHHKAGYRRIEFKFKKRKIKKQVIHKKEEIKCKIN